MKPARRGRRRLGFETRFLLLSLGATLPGSLVALLLLWTGDHTPRLRWTLTAVVILVSLALAFSLRRKVVYRLQTMSNIIGAIREGDFSLRGRGARRDDALGEVMVELNALSGTLHDERLDAMEATTLLSKVMTTIDVAVFAFDAQQVLRLANRAGERLLALPAEHLIGRRASELGLSDFLRDEAPQVLERTFPGASGRWEARRSIFRQGGLPMELLVIADLSRALRQEERRAWQRLIRVLGHEMNNSLAPIRSLAASLESLLERAPRPADWEEDVRKGMAVIGARAAALSRFMDAYARLARLPEPRLEPLDLGTLVRRVVGLETRMPVVLTPGPDMMVSADGDQIEQLLINLVRNAVDAALETGGGVTVGWARNHSHLELFVQDEGPGLPATANLFVPFFTTKQGGSGIGLVLSRQIAEAHGGSLVLKNRRTARGCEAHLHLPLS